jgi:hypothetical protein
VDRCSYEGRLLLVSRLLIVLILLFPINVIYAQPTTVESRIIEAFTVLEEASKNGGDVSNLVSQLNEVIWEVNTGDFDELEVKSKLDGVISEAEQINTTTLIDSRNRLIGVGFTIFIIIILEVLVWRYFPTIFWELWLRYRGHWIVK